MNPRILGILSIITVVLVGTAYWIARPRAAGNPEQSAHPASGPLFVGLDKKLPTSREITIKDATKSVTLRRPDDTSPWMIVEKGGYPAAPRVADLLGGLMNLSILEDKTARPDRLGLLGLNDPSTPGSTGKVVTLKDGSGNALASLIVGNSAEPGARNPRSTSGGSMYVRRAGENQSYLASGLLPADPDPMSWVERQVFQLERNRVKTITITRHDDPPAEDPAMAGTFELFRESSKAVEFKIRAMPPGREAQGSHATDQPATVLGYVYADDVTPVEKVDFSKCEAPAPPKPDAPAEKATPFSRTTSRYVTFDGVIVIVRVTKQDGKYYAAFAASFDEKERVEAPPAPKEGEAKPAEPSVPSADQVTLKAIDDAKKESLELAGKHEKWAYVIPEYSAKQLASRLSDMLKPPAQPTTVGPELQGPPVPGGPGENLLLPPK